MFFFFTGKSSVLSSDFNPPIQLDSGVYELGLTNFEVYNAIPNIQHGINKFYIGKEVIELPTGCYQLIDMHNYLVKEINKRTNNRDVLTVHGNNNTLKVHIRSNEAIDFTKPDNIGSLLGFKPKVLVPDVPYESDTPADIMKLSSIVLKCNITTGSYKNGVPDHILHQFFPQVPPGFKIVETPFPIIYRPLNVDTIRNITIEIVDQDEALVNFREEVVTVGVHLKKRDGY